MSPERIREYLHRQPFVPFTIYTGDGSTVRVRSPEFAVLEPRGRTLTVTTGEQVRGFSEIQVVDVFLITKLGLLEAPSLLRGLVDEPQSVE